MWKYPREYPRINRAFHKKNSHFLTNLKMSQANEDDEFLFVLL